MIWTAIAFFALAAILGMLLLGYVLGDKDTPKGIAFLHGGLAVVGLILLVLYTTGEGPGPLSSIILFIIAATGGLILIARDLARKPIPKWLAVVHGLVAVSGFVTLLLFALS